MRSASNTIPSHIGDRECLFQDNSLTRVWAFGGWRLQVTVRDCNTGQPLRPTFPAVFTFARGGTATGITGGQLPSLFTPQFGGLAAHSGPQLHRSDRRLRL